MLPKHIPDFIEQVMEQIEIGIDRVASKKLEHVVEPPAGVDPPLVQKAYPEHVELLLNVDAEVRYDDVAETEPPEYESQSLWVKIPWPKRFG
jgi:hypothetical protein